MWWRRRNAFKVVEDGGGLETIPIGSQSEYLIRVTPWKRVTLGHLNVRLIPSKTTSREAQRVPAEIAHVKSWSFVARGGERVPSGDFSEDNRGGMTCELHQPITCTSDKDLILSVQISAEKSWCGGYLSVRADIGEDKTYFGRVAAQTARKE